MYFGGIWFSYDTSVIELSCPLSEDPSLIIFIVRINSKHKDDNDKA